MSFLDELYYGNINPNENRNRRPLPYIERNYEMIDNSRYCICYYDENYAPPRRKNSRRDLFDYQPKSGTRMAFDYARKQGLNIINETSTKG